VNNTSISSLWGKMATRPVSLPMILHKCHDYYRLSEDLNEYFFALSLTDSNAPLEDGDRTRIDSIADNALELARALKGIDPSVLSMVDRIQSDLKDPSTLKAGQAGKDLDSLNDILKRELESRTFLYIPAPDNKRIRQSKPFGNKVYQAFPSARVELTNAGTALAVELYTASIFHLMRATEVAMRALCNDRGITLIKGAPVEMAQWQEILAVLDQETLKIANWPRALGNIKVQAQQFYNEAVSEFRGIKDEWRNHVAHTRTDYRKPQAESATDHVKRLLKTLATRVSETDRTPTVWTAAELR
jgi:hypothetical protein